MKRILLFFALGVALLAQNWSSPVTTADISGDGAVHAIASSGTARWITFRSLSSNSTTTCGTSSISGCVRIGDANISSTQGTYLLPGESAYMNESSGAVRYPLNGWFYLVRTGDKIMITYGQ